MKVSIPIGYIDGYSNSCHYELEVTPEQYEALKNGDIDTQDELLIDDAIVIDCYSINDIGKIRFDEMKIIEE